MQLAHESVPFQDQQFPIVLVCDSLVFQPNIGSIFRISEAFGVEKIIFLGIGNQMNPRKINKTSRSTHLHVPYELYDTKEDVLAYLIENDFEIIALEITTTSIPLETITIPQNKKIALLIGNEIEGISEYFLNYSHQIAHIEMFGKNSSMNVVQATGIALYEITKYLKNNINV
ncbi:SpoU rRNA Methylase family protein [Flavobacterium succinicans]|uniref:SpoU rRNA Methylase family protein n=1 Tax=Flavobacterium succinicans TaxID=29536 RepID=A0A1I4WFE2_9FLAO|nr:TrmH family RNA methyltransferase [Flavobacterium succinicans]SFN12564.1 SpoU rRNA Methylase family protein [Flavobacterium succinicans]